MTEIFDIEVRVGVTVEAITQEEAESIAHDWTGVTMNAPESIHFSWAEVLK